MRHNDHCVLFAKSPDAQGDGPRRHPNSFKAPGVIQIAWVGASRSSEKKGVVGSHKALDIVCGLAGVMCTAQTVALKRVVGERGEPLLVLRHYDFTPIKVRFGALQAEVMPHARYWRHDGHCWQVVPFEEVSRRFGGNLRYGTVDIFC